MTSAGIDAQTPFTDITAEEWNRVIGVNLTGVWHTVKASVPHFGPSGGSVVIISSSNGLRGTANTAAYTSTKHAVVGLVRSAGPVYALESIRINGICPGFSDTRIIDGFKDGLVNEGIPIIEVDHVVDGIVDLIDSPDSGVCHFVQAGMEPQEFRFRNIPGPKAAQA